MTNVPDVSIVVPSRTGDVSALRAHLARQSLRNWELVVDTHPPTPARARNLGAAQAEGRWLIFLDDDVELGHEHLLADVIDALQSVGPNAAVGVPCRLTPHATPFQRRHFNASFAVGATCSTERLTRVSWRDSVNGRCMAMWRETFEALGGFDSQSTASEEPELLYRLCQQGGCVYMLWSGWVYYEPPKTLREAIQKTVWYERGNSQFARKHPEADHRLALRSRWHGAWYLLLRTVFLAPLMFIKVSYHYRTPRLAFRPMAALLSYLGAWAYCLSWFATSRSRRMT